MRWILVVSLLGTVVGCQKEPPASKTAPVRASLLSSQLDRVESARSFVHGQKEQFDATGLVVARYLERRFGESFGLDYAAGLSADTQRCAESQFNAPALGLEMGDQVAPDDFYIARAFQCQTHPLPSGFWDGIRTYTVEEPKGLDQVALAVQIALEQRCVENDQYVQEIRELQTRKLEEALSSGDSPIDTTYLKRLAAWLYIEAGPVADGWIARVRDAQLDDGGWAAIQGSEEPDPTSSLLGFWFLLATESDRKPADVHFVEGKIETPSKAPTPYELP